MASSADSRQSTPSRLPLPRRGESSKSTTKKSCDTSSGGKSCGKTSKETGQRKVPTVGNGPKRNSSAIACKSSVSQNKGQTHVSRESRRDSPASSKDIKATVSKEIKKEQISDVVRKEKQQTTVSKQTAIVKEPSATIVDVKNEALQHQITEKVKHRPRSQSKYDQRAERTRSWIQSKSSSEDDILISLEQCGDLAVQESPSLKREQTVIYCGPKRDQSKVSPHDKQDGTEVNTHTTANTKPSCLNENSNSDVKLRNKISSVETKNDINEIQQTKSDNIMEVGQDVNIRTKRTKSFSQHRRESRKGKISDSSDSGVSLGGNDIAQFDDFCDETIGVQAKKEVQEFSEIIGLDARNDGKDSSKSVNIHDTQKVPRISDSNNHESSKDVSVATEVNDIPGNDSDQALVSCVNSNVVETSVATITNLKERDCDFDNLDDTYAERGSTYLGIQNYVPSNLKVRLLMCCHGDKLMNFFEKFLCRCIKFGRFI